VKRLAYLVVEGQPDVALIARLMKSWGIAPVRHKSKLESFWHPVIPRIFPVDDDLLKRVPVPGFFESSTHSIAIHAAGGLRRLVETLDETRAVLDHARIASYGFLLDADDTSQTPQRRFDKLIGELKARQIDLPWPDNPGDVAGDSPSFGVFILPDNQNAGTLENILLQGGEANYTNLATAARDYIDGIDRSQRQAQDLEEFNKPVGALKARIGSMASVLRPGRAIQVSIEDNRWLDGDWPSIRSIRNFLAKLLGLSQGSV